MIKKYLIYILIISIGWSCDSIKDVKAPSIVIANIPQNTILTLSSVFPDGKNFVAKEVSPGHLWEIKLESNGKNYQILTDFDGDILNTDEIYGLSLPIPNNINIYLKDKFPGAAINSISKTHNIETPSGFEVNIFDKNQSKKLNFDLNGNFKKDEIDLNKLQIENIIYSNNNLYESDNEIVDEIKTYLKTIELKNFDLKLLLFKTGETLVGVYEKENKNNINENIEYLFDKSKAQVRKYEYLNTSLLNYLTINNLDSYNINEKDKQILQKYQFVYGTRIEKFNLENISDLAFTDNFGYKYFVKFASKNSNPDFFISKKIEQNQIPTEIASYLQSKNYNLISAREEYIKTSDPNLSNTKIERYNIEIEVVKNNNTVKKKIYFDNNFKPLTYGKL
jgi:hypothetical protein